MEGDKNNKREQLATLLITKFRNKYNVNATKDSSIDKIIVDEVRKLLKQGNANESNLVKLDRKLG